MATGAEIMMNMLLRQFGIDKEDAIAKAMEVQRAVIDLSLHMEDIAVRLKRIEAHMCISEPKKLELEHDGDTHVER